MRLLRLFAAILFSLCVASVAALSASLPFTRQVKQSFGSEPSPVPFYAVFVFFAVDPKFGSCVNHKERKERKERQEIASCDRQTFCGCDFQGLGREWHWGILTSDVPSPICDTAVTRL